MTIIWFSGSNASGQGWYTQVEDLAEHFNADFDGSLSALAASDLATAVASYTMRWEFLPFVPDSFFSFEWIIQISKFPSK